MASEALTQFVSLGPIEIAYTDIGSGPVVLNAHGLTSSRAAVRLSALGDFTEVGARRRLVSYDARGHGESGGSSRPEDYAWPALAQDLLLLADHFSRDKPISAIGLSMGTATLLHAALARPERFERLVLSAPPTAWETRSAQAQLYETLASFAESHSLQELSEHFAKQPVAPIFRDLPPVSHTPDIAHALLPAVFRGAGLSNFPARDDIRKLQHETLILAWDSDPGHPVSSAEQLLQLLPHAQLHVSKTSDDIRSWGERAARFLDS